MNVTYRKNQENNLRWIERISYLLDEKFRLPGTNFRFGLDPLLNLIPFAGDLSGFLLSAVLVITMATYGASRKVIILMAINITLDFLIGGIPVIGQIFDFFFKANKKNIRLLKEHYEEGKHQGSGKGVLIIITLILLGIVLLSVFIFVKLMQWIF